MKKAIIKKIYVWDDCVEMYVQCPYCGSINHHTITGSTSTKRSSKGEKRLKIDFSKLGTRCCGHRGWPTYCSSRSNYELH